MKKLISYVVAGTLLAVPISSVLMAFETDQALAASPEKTSQQAMKKVKEEIEVIEKEGYTVTIKTTTVNENIEDYVSKLRSQGQRIHTAGFGNSTISTDYVQEDYFSGMGYQYNGSAGGTGYIYCHNGFIGLEIFGGYVSAYLTASSTGGLKAKNRMVLTTYGAVGGSFGAIKEYVFTNNNWSVAGGNPSLSISSSLTGMIGYYQISAYGDFTDNYNHDFTVLAKLE